MKKTKKRVQLAAVLALCLAGTAAAAAAISLDRNADGIVNIWDAQNAAQDPALTDAEKENLLALIREDVMNSAEVTQIGDAAGLQAMQANGRYRLSDDIDLQGAAWMPVDNFSGILDGGGHTISNFTLAAAQSGNQGFFGTIAVGGAVENLHLRNVVLTVSESAGNAGMLAGANNGTIRNCTVSGTITAGGSSAVIGIAAGTNNGTVKLGSFSVYAGENDSFGVDAAAEIRHDMDTLKLVGAGTAAEGAPMWRDNSHSTAYLDQTLQDRRQAAVAHMYAMATVKWSPAQTLKEYRCYYNSYTTPIFQADNQYTGIPYSHGACSLERFTYALVQDGAAVHGETVGTEKGQFLDPISVYLASDLVEELQDRHDYEDDGTYYWQNEERLTMIRNALGQVTHETIDWGDPDTGGISGQTMAGYGRWIGNDCSSSVMYAWWRAANADTANGGAAVMQASLMRPTRTGGTVYGILPLGGFYYDEAAETPGADCFAQAYALAGQADAVANYDHVRMLACDPVVIRSADGAIQIDSSYMVTIEHGGVSDGNTAGGCGWGIFCRYTFRNLIEKGYYPATIGAWNRVDCDGAAEKNFVTIENSVITSNAHILRVQAGDRIFHTGVEQARYGDKAAGTHGFRDVYTSVDLGKTNTFAGMTDFSEQTIMVTLADGSVWTSTNGSAFLRN